MAVNEADFYHGITEFMFMFMFMFMLAV